LFYFEADIIDKGKIGRLESGFAQNQLANIKCQVVKIANGVIMVMMEICIAFRDLKNALYSCVAILSPGGTVGANFGYRKFKYTEFEKNLTNNEEEDKILSIEIEDDIELDVKDEVDNSEIEEFEDEYMEILFKLIIRGKNCAGKWETIYQTN
ncbi:1859_t:CDS:2, partial [Funneliformis geosporum]